MAIGVAQIADIGANSRQPILDNNVFCPIHRLSDTNASSALISHFDRARH